MSLGERQQPAAPYHRRAYVPTTAAQGPDGTTQEIYRPRRHGDRDDEILK